MKMSRRKLENTQANTNIIIIRERRSINEMTHSCAAEVQQIKSRQQKDAEIEMRCELDTHQQKSYIN